MVSEFAIWSKYYGDLKIQVFAPNYYYSLQLGKDEYSKRIVDSKNNDLSAHFFDEVRMIFSKLSFTPDVIVIIPASKIDNFSPTIVSLCEKLSNALNIPFEKFIQRVKERKKLSNTASEDERFDSVNGAFKVTKKLNGERIVLLDDTKVSGASLLECGKELKKAGASNIEAICLGINVKWKK